MSSTSSATAAAPRDRKVQGLANLTPRLVTYSAVSLKQVLLCAPKARRCFPLAGPFATTTSATRQHTSPRIGSSGRRVSDAFLTYSSLNGVVLSCLCQLYNASFADLIIDQLLCVFLLSETMSATICYMKNYVAYISTSIMTLQSV